MKHSNIVKEYSSNVCSMKHVGEQRKKESYGGTWK